MRDILFRGKTVLGKWIEGDLLQYLVWGKVHIVRNYKGAGGQEVIPETVGQYTGLTDKNGKKIFEGDIIKCRDNRLHIVKIGEFYPERLYKLCSATNEIISGSKYIGKIYGVYCECLGSAYKGEHFVIPPRNAVEIVGNIHDNPELLKGGGEE